MLFFVLGPVLETMLHITRANGVLQALMNSIGVRDSIVLIVGELHPKLIEI